MFSTSVYQAINYLSGRAALLDQRLRSERDADAWQRLPRQRLAALLRHAVGCIPFYRAAAGLRSAHISAENAIESLECFPLLDKELIRSRHEEFRCRVCHHQGVRWNASGGSTGEPLRFLQDRRYRNHNRAAAWHSDMIAGWRPGSPMALIWGGSTDAVALRTVFGALKNRLKNVLWLDSFRMSDSDVVRFVAQMEAARVEFILGYASSLFLAAELLDQKALRPHLPLRGIVASAEPLLPWYRATIERVFNASVFDRYGSREVGLIAYECAEHSGLHVNQIDNHVEVLPDGEIVITNLNNYVMPLIRYRIGDLGVWASGECRCGRVAARLTRVAGRTVDTLRGADGTLVHGEFFTHLFYQVTGVQQFQVVQRGVDQFEIHVAPAAPAGGELERLLQTCRQRLGTEKVSLCPVQRIPVHRSGKHRFVRFEDSAT